MYYKICNLKAFTELNSPSRWTGKLKEIGKVEKINGQPRFEMKKRVNEAESHSEAIPDGRSCEESDSQNTGEIQIKRERSSSREGMETESTQSCDDVWLRKRSQPERASLQQLKQRPSCFSQTIKTQHIRYTGHSLSTVKLLAASPFPHESMDSTFLHGRIRKGQNQLSKYKQL